MIAYVRDILQITHSLGITIWVPAIWVWVFNLKKNIWCEDAVDVTLKVPMGVGVFLFVYRNVGGVIVCIERDLELAVNCEGRAG